MILIDWNEGRIPFYTLPPQQQLNTVLDSDIVNTYSNELDIDKLITVETIRDEYDTDAADTIDNDMRQD